MHITTSFVLPDGYNGFIGTWGLEDASMYPFDARQIKRTWAERIVSRHNTWLEATHKEDDGDIASAAILYCKDVSNCLESANLARAALSCSCIARCLYRTGNTSIARILFEEAASIYEENADYCLDKSIRESAWSLERACENFVLAGNRQEATEVYYRAVSLLNKISPLGSQDTSARSETPEQMFEMEPHDAGTFSLPPTPDLISAVRKVLESRNSYSRLAQLDELLTQ